MSDTEPDPETFEAAKEIHDKKDDVVGEMREQHDALLEAVAEDEEVVVDEYEMVELGNVELKVKTDISGGTYRKLDALWSGDVSPAKELDVTVEVLCDQTSEISANGDSWDAEDRIRLFWRDVVDEYGMQQMTTILEERIINGPIDVEAQRKKEVVESFPGNKQSPKDRGPREWRS